MRERLTSLPGRSVLYAAVIFVLGLAYRATFLSQGFNGTDEGWLQTLGQRIANGQVPYRDFYFVLPPVSAYREALLIKVLGDAYGILGSRWAFAVEATLASVVAFIILRRFVGDHLALLSTLPTIFFSVIFYYFSNYTYDAVFFVLLAIACLTYGARAPRALAAGAGVAAALAFLSKPTFLVFLVLLPLGGLIHMRLADRPSRAQAWWHRAADWRFFALGYVATCAAVFGYLAIAGAFGQFFYQAFVLTREAFPTSLAFLVLQDMPDRLLSWPAGPALVIIAVLLLVRGSRFIDLVRTPLLVIVLAYFVFRVVLAPGSGPPTGRQQLLVVLALGVLLVIDAAALVLAVLRRDILPADLVFYAVALQYVTQINYSGLVYSYMGTYLSLPVAIIVVRRWLAPRARGLGGVEAAIPAVTAALLGAWFIAGGIAVTRGTVYRDAARSELTARFSTGKLSGISTRSANVALIDGMTAAIERYSVKGEPILVLPDFPVMYFATDRVNPTKIDWYDPGEIIPSMTQQAVDDLQRRPARVVLMQTYDEADVARAGPPLDYLAQPKWRAMYAYLKAHYRQVAMVGDVAVLVPAS